jgi:amino acid transporter
MFVRKASGLVRAWSVFDAFIYAFFSINLITLGLYIFSFAPFIPEGHLVIAIIISAVFILFEIVVYAMLISAMPRAGGDYVWQSRMLGGGIGFVLAATGWWFILWHWVPLYASMLAYEVVVPLLTIIAGWTGSKGLLGTALWFMDINGLFLTCLMVIGLAFVYVGLGMKWYARIQKTCFYIAMVGLATVFMVLLASSNSSFMASFNSMTASLFGAEGDVYSGIISLAAQEGYTPVAWGAMPIWASMPLIPMVVFFNLWPNWGATLYGEVRGASDFRRNFSGMALALLVTTVLAVIFLALIAKTIGWDFYHAANWTFWSGSSPLPVFPYPGLLAAFLTRNPLLQLWIIITMSAWFFGWAGTVFLSSTRMIFAAAFDRVLPEWVAHVTPKQRVPINALLLLAIPSIITSALYCYTPNFATYTLDATVVIAIMYLGTTVAAILLPYRDPQLYGSSPVARYTIFGLPWIVVAGVIFIIFLGYNLYMWIVDPVYGVNHPTSAVYMVILYLVAVGLYVGSKWYRRKQGIDLDMVYKNIPVE